MTLLSKIDIHIICFDVPLPENYGGVIDVYNRIKALHKAGLSIALHCFEYGRGEQNALKEYCSELHYYSRNKSLFNLLSPLPFIVASRKSNLLIKNLLKDNAPIFFEGHHSCYYLNDERLKDRQKWVRIHNVEQDYYSALAKVSRSAIKRLYYTLEARKIEKFEATLKNASTLFAITPEDVEHFKSINRETFLLPAFHSFKLKESELDVADFALYHANLAVEENCEAALFLIKVFSQLENKLVVAGREPSKLLTHAVSKCANIELVANPKEEELVELIRSAKVNCLYTQQATGVKLKLIRALIEGNSIIGNSKLFEGTTFGVFCHTAESTEEWREKIQEVFAISLDEDQIAERKRKAIDFFDNDKNSKMLIELIQR